MESSSTRFLKGRTIAGLSQPVKTVLARGDQRTIVTEGGERLTVSKRKLTSLLHSAIGAEQLSNSLRSVRTNSDGTAAITIGGSERGTRKTYISTKAAQAAAHRYYSK